MIGGGLAVTFALAHNICEGVLGWGGRDEIFARETSAGGYTRARRPEDKTVCVRGAAQQNKLITFIFSIRLWAVNHPRESLNTGTPRLRLSNELSLLLIIALWEDVHLVVAGRNKKSNYNTLWSSLYLIFINYFLFCQVLYHLLKFIYAHNSDSFDQLINVNCCCWTSLYVYTLHFVTSYHIAVHHITVYNVAHGIVITKLYITSSSHN